MTIHDVLREAQEQRAQEARDEHRNAILTDLAINGPRVLARDCPQGFSFTWDRGVPGGREYTYTYVEHLKWSIPVFACPERDDDRVWSEELERVAAQAWWREQRRADRAKAVAT
ncbi:MAG: hypothetical protein IT454_10450 [Planctomycetes bacterium]|nr:hypothetical protein [Planctomycetota bacterium]